MRFAIAVAVIALSLSAASPAAAAGVPGEVTTYIANDLIDDLNEFYGPGQDGAGLLFTNDTTTTPAVRVLGFTPGIDSDPAVRRLNRWVTVIAIDETIVGVATVSIEPLSTTPQLDLYIASPEFGTVIAALPEAAQLVSDPEHEAWFSLEGDQLTPLVAGTSGLTVPASIDLYRASLLNSADAAPASPAPPTGLIIVGLVLVAVVLALAVERFLPFWRRAPRVEPVETERVEPVETATAERVEPVETPTPEIAAEPVAKPRASRKRAPASN